MANVTQGIKAGKGLKNVCIQNVRVFMIQALKGALWGI
jgi:hypothetical protein